MFLCLFTLWVLNCCHTISISCWKSALWSRTQNMVTFITARLASLALSLLSLYKSTRRHPLTIKCHWVERSVVLNVIRLLFLMKRKHLELVTNKRDMFSDFYTYATCNLISCSLNYIYAFYITFLLFILVEICISLHNLILTTFVILIPSVHLGLRNLSCCVVTFCLCCWNLTSIVLNCI